MTQRFNERDMQIECTSIKLQDCLLNEEKKTQNPHDESMNRGELNAYDESAKQDKSAKRREKFLKKKARNSNESEGGLQDLINKIECIENIACDIHDVAHSNNLEALRSLIHRISLDVLRCDYDILNITHSLVFSYEDEIQRLREMVKSKSTESQRTKETQTEDAVHSFRVLREELDVQSKRLDELMKENRKLTFSTEVAKKLTRTLVDNSKDNAEKIRKLREENDKLKGEIVALREAKTCCA